MNIFAVLASAESLALRDSLVQSIVFGLLVCWPIALIVSFFFKRSKQKKDAEIQIMKAELKDAAERRKTEQNTQTMTDFERREKEKWAAYKAEKAKKEAEEAQKKEDARILTAMDELETGNLDKLTWGKALIAADGDEKRAKVEYLKTRKLD